MSNDEMTFERFMKEMKEYEEARAARGLVAPNVIPTMYKGVQFRSRLEARWAVFFDTLGIKWEYEPQGYEIGLSYEPQDDEMIYTYSDGSTGGMWTKHSKEDSGLTVVLETPVTGKEYLEWYLPDFWLPELKIWAEVKGVFSDDELLTTVRAIDGWSMGLPNVEDYDKNNPTGILYLGDIPNLERNKGTGSHIIFTRRKGVENRVARFRFNELMDRVELEVGETYNPWMYLDVTLPTIDSMMNASDGKEDVYRHVVKGLARDKIRLPYTTYRGDDVSPWNKDGVYPSVEDDVFGEKVISAGWAAARNAQF